MARGDGGKMVFETDDDRLVFLKRLEESMNWLNGRNTRTDPENLVASSIYHNAYTRKQEVK